MLAQPLPLQALAPVTVASAHYIALIDNRVLARECLAHSLTDHHIQHRVITFSDLAEWQQAKPDLGLPAAVLLNTDQTADTAQTAAIVEAVSPAPVVVLADNQDINTVLDTIALGVRGYIPTSVSIDVCIMAISLAMAGGKFIPASSLLSIKNQLGLPTASPVASHNLTSRQSAVAEALRCGKANRDIASELNLCESTIKVHIRNIMKKLGATNRTEVAYKIGDLGYQL